MGPDPGDCPICGTAHCACTSGGPISVPLLPLVGAVEAPPLVGDVTSPTLGDGSDDRPFSTATYRGKKKKR